MTSGAALLAITGASLVGSAHCAAMCGGFGCLAAAQGPRSHAAYHLGRLGGYATLGLAAGAAGAALDLGMLRLGIGRVAPLLMGALLLGWGLVLWRGAGRAGAAAAGEARTARIAAILRRGARWSPTARGLLLGLVTALLPCGWLWLFVATATAAGSPLHGAATMAAFWLGTVPLLALAGGGAERLLAGLGRWRPRVAAAAVIVVGLATIAQHLRHRPASAPAAVVTVQGHHHD